MQIKKRNMEHAKFFEESDELLFEQYIAFNVLLNSMKRGEVLNDYYKLHFKGSDNLYDNAYREYYPNEDDEDFKFLQDSVDQAKEKIYEIRNQLSKMKAFTNS